MAYVDTEAAAAHGLTERQLAALRALYRWAAAGRPATLRELAAELGSANPNAAVCHVNVLRRKGYLPPAGDKESRLLVPLGLALVPAFEETEQGRRLRAAVEGGEP